MVISAVQADQHRMFKSFPGWQLNLLETKSTFPSNTGGAPRINDDRPLLTLGEAAQFLRVSKAHLSNIVNRKVASLPPIPVVRIGRRSLLRRDALVEWLKSVEQ
jgi:excisionase family DNA binding protein